MSAGRCGGRLEADAHPFYEALRDVLDHEARQAREQRWANRWPRSVSRWGKLVPEFERRDCVMELSAECKKVFVSVGYRACPKVVSVL